MVVVMEAAKWEEEEEEEAVDSGTGQDRTKYETYSSSVLEPLCLVLVGQ